MSRTTAPLSDSAYRSAKPTDRAYKLFDGDGLYLLVQPNGRKGWRLRHVKPEGREGLSSEIAIERQMSHKERNNVRTAYTSHSSRRKAA